MLLRTRDTIVAIASAAGGGLRGIVRMSGADCLAIAQRWFRAASPQSLAELRQPAAFHGTAMLNEHGDALPGELLVWPGRRSYTREPTVEFHTLGSPPLLARLVQTICQRGARPAEPGEFTLRAFLAGRLDLTQAEAVLGVIDAGSQTELTVALRQLGGGLAAPLTRLRDELLDVLAHLEAGLDFVEEDIEFIGRAELREKLCEARDRVASLRERTLSRPGVGERYRVVLYGLPNAGKSSLFNALVQSQQAIVSPAAGTTRDYLAAEIDCAGYPCLLIDTAGIETPATQRHVEAAAQSQSQQQWREAHVRLWCLDCTGRLDLWERAEQSRDDPRRILVITKCDAADPSERSDDLRTSAVAGFGLDRLRQAIAERLAVLAATQSDVVAGTAARCRDSLDHSLASLEAAIAALDNNLGEELVAGDIRIALEELGRIAGAVYTDDLLDRIFSRFCIGK